MPQPQTNRPKYLKDLLLLFSVPVAITLLALGIVYTPRLLANPGYDFMYTVCTTYRCKDEYTVNSNGYIEHKTNISNRIYSDDQPAELYYYSTKQNNAKRITFEEAQSYKLDTSLRSPDGYSLTRETTGGGFLFWGDYSEDWYLKNGAKKKKVELTSNGSYYAGDIKFLGWVSK